MSTCIRNITLFDGRSGEAQADSCLEIGADGRIGYVGPAAECPVMKEAQVIDGGGQFLMPGLIDAHLHICFNGVEAIGVNLARPREEILLESVLLAKRTLQQGTTSIRDVGGHQHVEMHLRAAIEKGWFPGPRMKTSGTVICMTGGHAHFIGREADGPDELRKAAREQIKAGADVVKLMGTGGSATPGQDVQASQLTREEMAAAVDAAHSMGRAVAVHAHGSGGIINATLAGVDSIEHGSYLTDECARLMAERGTQLVVTLGVAYPEYRWDEWSADQRADYQRRKAGIESSPARYRNTLRIARERGVFLACGTDAGGNCLSPHHFAMHREVELLVEYGVPAAEALVCATHHNAQVLRMDDEIGALERGKWADLLLLKGNPLRDIRQLRAVAAVWKGGQPVRLDD